MQGNMVLQKKGRYDLMYQKAKQLGGRTNKAKANTVTDHQ